MPPNFGPWVVIHLRGIAAGKTYGVAKKANILAVKVLGDNGYGLVVADGSPVNRVL